MKGFPTSSHRQFSTEGLIDDGDETPLAQKAKLGFKLLLFERLNENLKQKHF